MGESYRQAVEFLEQGLNLERLPEWRYNGQTLNLLRTERLLAALGDPLRAFRVIHVAGTKGKGTTATAAAHILQSLGFRTGLVTSPHLVTHRERSCIDGRMISEADFAGIIAAMKPYVEAERQREAADDGRAPTYFEMLTALAFEHFRREGVAWAVVEVGLGGRLDSTNVVQPECCVIADIGFDHMDKLGNTIQAIAGEKAGIVKPGVPVVIGRQHYPAALETLRSACSQAGCAVWEVGREVAVTETAHWVADAEQPGDVPGWRFDLRTPGGDFPDLFTPLLGRHQVDNLAAAAGAVLLSRAGDGIPADVLREALAGFSMPGRLELVGHRPALVLDVAHTVESVEAMLHTLDTHFPGRPVRVVFGCSRDKNVGGMLDALRGRCVSFTATQAMSPSVRARVLPVDELSALARAHGLEAAGAHVSTCASPAAAVAQAMAEAEPQDVVCVAGSFYVTGEVREAVAPGPD
jgi:dihydrofolate synthase/folylpolyglutamate synthase